MADITIRGVRKSFGAVQALRHVDLTVRDGEFLTLLGPSGSGKTTLLNILQGFENADAGSILLGDRDITSLAPRERGFGMVFQSYALFPHMTVAENVGYPLRARGVKRRARDEAVSRTLGQVQLSDFAARMPGQLSGGQQQRVALARAMVFQPPVLLMDEPLAALDRRLRQSMQLNLKELHERINATILYVTHDQEEALVMSDRICVMRDGQIAQIGTPDEIYGRPASPFVASFLGETNLLTGQLTVSDRGVALQLADGTRLPMHPPSAPPSGGPVTVSIRPEDLLIVDPDHPIGGTRASLSSTVYLGDSWRLTCTTPGGTPLVVKRDVAAPKARQGDQVLLAVRDQAAVVFDLSG
jgi:ABC-type Fe3+/spermidine/putrescine transport system ATPase subunit